MAINKLPLWCCFKPLATLGNSSPARGTRSSKNQQCCQCAVLIVIIDHLFLCHWMLQTGIRWLQWWRRKATMKTVECSLQLPSVLLWLTIDQASTSLMQPSCNPQTSLKKTYATLKKDQCKPHSSLNKAHACHNEPDASLNRVSYKPHESLMKASCKPLSGWKLIKYFFTSSALSHHCRPIQAIESSATTSKTTK